MMATPLAVAGWDARLWLNFRNSGGRSVLAERRHQGPLVVQKALYPEGAGICHAVIVHAPGGIAGGDRLTTDITAEPGAHALITTPAAGKWYKSGGQEARQSGTVTIASGAIVEYLPQEAILFDAAQARIGNQVSLEPNAVYAGWEIMCLGRRASHEAFRIGALHQKLIVHRDGRLIWNERLLLEGGSRIMHALAGFAGHTVFGSMIVAAGATPAERLEACRALSPRTGQGGVTALPEIFSARYLGDRAEHAKDYFESLRAVLRPWYAGRPAQRPRLWDT